jgi:uncharacterized protein Yka (UPF0111/DUF47 family)
MNRNNLLNIFAPKYSLLFPYFEDYTGSITSAAEYLKLIMQTVDPEQQNVINRQINELQNKSYNLTYDIYSLLKKLFIIPFDREDMNELVIRIGDVLESIVNITRIMHFHRPVEICPAYKEMAEIIYLASIETGYIVNGLNEISRNRSFIILGCENLMTLEKRANEVFYSEILKLVIVRENLPHLTKRKNILEALMKCIRKTYAASETTRTILRKSS